MAHSIHDVIQNIYLKNSFKIINSKSIGFDDFASLVSCSNALTNVFNSAAVTLAPMEYGMSGTAYLILVLNNHENRKVFYSNRKKEMNFRFV